MEIAIYAILIVGAFSIVAVLIAYRNWGSEHRAFDEQVTNTASSNDSDDGSVVLRDAFDDVLARIESLEGSQTDVEASDRQELPDGLTKHLGPLLERVPTAADTAQDLVSETYRVASSPELLEGVQDGSLEMMRSQEVQNGLRLNVVSKKGGEVVGQGNLVPKSKVLKLASAGFQLASFATGQVHLAQIDKRLEELNKGVQDVRKHLENQQEGELHGKLRYLRKITTQLRNDSLVEVDVATVNNQLETIERETLELGAAIQKEIQQRRQELKEIKLGGMTKTAKQEADKLSDHSERYTETLRRYQLVFWARLVAVELKAMLPVDQSIIAHRREEIRNDLREFQDAIEDHRQRSLERTESITGRVRN